MVLVARQAATIHRIEGRPTCAIVINLEAAFRFGPCELKEAIPDRYAVSRSCHWHHLREERSLTSNSPKRHGMVYAARCRVTRVAASDRTRTLTRARSEGQVPGRLDHSALEDGTSI